MFRHHPVLSLVTFAYLGVVAWVTLGPQPLDDRASGLLWRVLRFLSRHEETAWVDYNLVEFTANVAMFVPVGLFFLLLLGRRQWWLAVFLGVALTAAIEFAQRFTAERVSDPRDILANSTGALIGVLAALVVTWPAARRRRAVARAAGVRASAQAG